MDAILGYGMGRFLKMQRGRKSYFDVKHPVPPRQLIRDLASLCLSTLPTRR